MYAAGTLYDNDVRRPCTNTASKVVDTLFTIVLEAALTETPTRVVGAGLAGWLAGMLTRCVMSTDSNQFGRFLFVRLRHEQDSVYIVFYAALVYRRRALLSFSVPAAYRQHICGPGYEM